MKKNHLIVAGAFGLWLIAAITSYNVAFLTKGIVQFFATGMSSFKDYFFLFWATLCFLSLSLKIRTPKVNLSRYLYCLILVLGALNFLSFAIFTSKFHLQYANVVRAVAGRSISSNALMHTHTLKPMLMPLINSLGLHAVLQRADPGLPYYDLLPHSLFYLGLPLVLVTSFLFIRELMRKEREWDRGFRWGFVFIYVVSSFAIIKSFFDGGPLSSEFIMYVPIFYLITHTRQKTLSLLWQEYKYCLLTSFVVGVGIYAWVIPDYVTKFLRELAIFATFPVFLFLLVVTIANRKWKTIPVLLLLVAILSWNARNFFWGFALRNLTLSITPNDQIYLVNFNSENYPYPVRYRDGQLLVHVFHPAHDQKVWDIYETHRIPPAYARLNVAGQNCSETVDFTSSGKLLRVDTGDLAQPEMPEYFTYFTMKPCDIKQGTCYLYEVKIKGCLPNSADELVVNHLYEMGMKLFIMVPDEKFS